MGTHHLTAEQLAFYDDNGYLLLRNWIPQDLLKRLQEAAENWIEKGLHASEDDPDFDDYRFAQRPAVSGRIGDHLREFRAVDQEFFRHAAANHACTADAVFLGHRDAGAGL